MVSLLGNLVFVIVAVLALSLAADGGFPDSAPQRWLQTALGTVDEPEQTAPENGKPAQVAIGADWLGHYKARARIDGVDIPVLVDTGATLVSLTAADARRLGIKLTDADFRYPVSTANGVVGAALVRLKDVQLGGIRVRNVKALVHRGSGLQTSLLGMSFLNRLSRVEIAQGRLRLHQ